MPTLVLPTAESGASIATLRPIDGESTAPTDRVYRPCPVCGKLMHRRNYGRRSGVVVDSCRDDGVWFDQGELARVLGWIRDGGVERSRARDAENERKERSMQRLRTPAGGVGDSSGGDIFAGADVVGALLDLFSGS